jgi:hypothetical protein
MACAPCLGGPLTAARDQPLILRFLLHIHRGVADAERANATAADFAARPGYRVVKSTRPHRQFEIERT